MLYCFSQMLFHFAFLWHSHSVNLRLTLKTLGGVSVGKASRWGHAGEGAVEHRGDARSRAGILEQTSRQTTEGCDLIWGQGLGQMWSKGVTTGLSPGSLRAQLRAWWAAEEYSGDRERTLRKSWPWKEHHASTGLAPSWRFFLKDFVLLFFFSQYWGSNSRLHACKAATYAAKLNPQSSHGDFDIQFMISFLQSF